MRRNLILPLILAAVSVALVAPTGASAETSFTFYGSGNGHGIGMSQWGSFGLARAGWTAEQILGHYYTGTEVSDYEPAEPLRVGLATGKASIGLNAIGGEVPLVVGDEVVATIPDGETWTVVSSGNTAFEIRDATGTAVAGPIGDALTPVTATPSPARVKVTETGRTYARGTLELGLHACGSTCSIRAILVIDLEEYLYGLGEVPSSWPTEALRTQAIAARTYAANKAERTQHRSPCDCAVYATSYDQVYVGYEKESGTGGTRWVAAVDDTSGLVVTYEGDPIQAYYMSSSGGFTEDNDQAWGGAAIPYLRGVCDPGDYVPENPHATWTVTRSADQVTTALKLNVGTVTGFSVQSRGVSGRILSVSVSGTSGTTTISGGTLQSRLGLKDDRLWIGTNMLVTGKVRTKYDSLACAPGAPTTAQTTVSGGLRQKFERATIFQGLDLDAFSIDGAVLTFYLSQKGPRGSLGFPISDVRTLSNGAFRARFQGGTVTCKPAGTPCRIGTASTTG